MKTTPPGAAQAPQLSDKVTRQLLHEITHGRYSAQRRMPPEVTVAAHLGVSRNLLRDCLSTLEREGFISRKRGVGTIINQHVLAVPVRLDVEEEFAVMIQKAGYTPGVAWVQNSYGEANGETAARLGLCEGDRVYRSLRLVTADEKPLIYCEDVVPAALIKHEDYRPKDANAPIFTFLEEACECTVSMDLTEIQPIVADEALAGHLAVPLGSPLLLLREVGYDFFGSPILHSRETYANGMLHHTVLRKKI